MQIEKHKIDEHNHAAESLHRKRFELTADILAAEGVDVESIIKKINAFEIAIPSWALGTGGTRFGRFSGGGEPRSIEEKLEDVGLLHALNRSCGAISLHIPWDIPSDVQAIKELAASLHLKFDAVNSNTFQDQPNQPYSYKFGSLSHTDKAVRSQAVAHNIEVIKHGQALGSKALTVWLADGSNFPGQQHFRKAYQRTLESLSEIYKALPQDWNLLIEYKPSEPNFYSMVIPDWGTSFSLAQKLGKQAYTLVDFGHHLPNTNIEQIVGHLMGEGRLGGFHFNDSKYGDDDLTVGSLKPYQLFLVFNELVDGMTDPSVNNPVPAWMIDASHNTKDPLEDLLQSVEAIKVAYAQALLVDRFQLNAAQENNDVVRAQEILQEAFRTDVRALLAEARYRAGAAISPLSLYRSLGIRAQLVHQRGAHVMATGL